MLSHFASPQPAGLGPACASSNLISVPVARLPSRKISFLTYTAGVKIRFTTSRVELLPSLSCTVSWKVTESPVIFTT